MLNAALFRHYVPGAERKEYYLTTMPNQTRRMMMAQKIASRCGILGNRLLDYSANMTRIRGLSRTLFTLEQAGQIRITSSRIEYLASSKLPDVITNIMINRKYFGGGKFSTEMFKKACGDLFVARQAVPAYKENPAKSRLSYWIGPPISLLLAAKDIVAGRHFAGKTMAYHERYSPGFLPETYTAERFEPVWREVYRTIAVLAGKAGLVDSLDESNIGIPAMVRDIMIWENDFEFAARGQIDAGDTDGEKRKIKLLLSTLKRYRTARPDGSPVTAGMIKGLEDTLTKYLEDHEAAVDFENKLTRAVKGAKRLTIGELRLLFERSFEYSGDEADPQTGELAKLPPKILDRMAKLGIQLNDQPEIYGQSDTDEVSYLKYLKNSLILTPGLKSLRDEYDITMFVSDIHLQKFQHYNIFELLRFLHTAGRLGATVVLNGDTFDRWRARAAEKILAANRLVLNALNYIKQAVFIIGNHDDFLYAFKDKYLFSKRFPVLEQRYDPATRTFVEHGHLIDAANSGGSKLGEYVTRFLVTPLERLFGKQATKFLEYIGIKLKVEAGSIEDSKVNNIIARIKQKYKEFDDPAAPFSEAKPFNFVMGHIHAPGVAYFYGEVIKALAREPKLAGQVRYFLLPSWLDNEAGAGGVLCLARKKGDPVSPVFISSFIWETMTAEDILRHYSHEPRQL
ncbi:hypothetical protein A2625_06745 [candidate division WOR-1 bacterium RIFCSPHIGHO2_01_FULL_53_15]|uniref:Calcineurin-like phosphoesterase domain-containing protein n=1 Tax=candidate division WOR-1 bacterium RIFCSPHIGHO2_01_FULL_53_15 TaxID=1802564 RepID=A0A1F4Q4W7_UNCSA|nr:MAG: hypothetical protein A2625_06745 [candidate division WOR-1 bacterium RIFCSPHIGHO2_01_FULL_53_15]OGC10302.1 MAG: hypothetical protein A3D23_06750 [candidate division WOR-1 bacterium RIFCSPHIGHO2_02_FULL_53_26]